MVGLLRVQITEAVSRGYMVYFLRKNRVPFSRPFSISLKSQYLKYRASMQASGGCINKDNFSSLFLRGRRPSGNLPMNATFFARCGLSRTHVTQDKAKATYPGNLLDFLVFFILKKDEELKWRLSQSRRELVCDALCVYI